VATPGAHDVNLTGPDESLIAKYNYMSVVLPIELLAFDAETEGLRITCAHLGARPRKATMPTSPWNAPADAVLSSPP
jgi:hypothetical protein